jgi:hypothetical protein
MPQMNTNVFWPQIAQMNTDFLFVLFVAVLNWLHKKSFRRAPEALYKEKPRY